jgi:RsiW-degrading membrane proteinase PrsW (M82 family)
MNMRYWQALTVLGLALAVLIWAWIDNGDAAVPALVIASAGAPGAALLFASGRLERPPPIGAMIGGGTIGVAIALASHAIVFGFAYAFFFGFADEATSLLDRLRVDPKLTSALGSPWTVLLLIELAIVAPLTEELGKAVGSRLFHVTDRRSAFLAGVAAGTGFAIVENVFYGLSGGFLGDSWEAIVIGRMAGAAVHPLATGLVVMGWWEWRRDRNVSLLVSRFFSGVGVHAAWNGSIVVLSVAATAFDTATNFSTHTLILLAYTAALGLVTAGFLWQVTVAVAEDQEKLMTLDASDGRVVAAWTVLAASFIVPMAVLILAYPDFVGG